MLINKATKSSHVEKPSSYVYVLMNNEICDNTAILATMLDILVSTQFILHSYQN